ncbi:hypothetical protein [uncultured Campylobacter sp.]|uniref:hypothetical protein n=1 Tax=uncultured Campylobacter sp. TaxID=218934 RepID=UPI003211B307
MSPKNPVSNFISAGDEMLTFLSNLGQKWRISDDGAEFIERNFTFVGSKPVLQNLKDYKTADYKNFTDIKNFLNSNPNIQSKILSADISYIGDNLTNAEVKFVPEYFYDFLKFMLENIPEHHYFCASEAGWILLVAMEGYVEFAVLD